MVHFRAFIYFRWLLFVLFCVQRSKGPFSHVTIKKDKRSLKMIFAKVSFVSLKLGRVSRKKVLSRFWFFPPCFLVFSSSMFVPVFSMKEFQAFLSKTGFPEKCWIEVHTIVKVKFLFKKFEILTKPQHFHEFFTKFFLTFFVVKSKFSTAKKSKNHNIFTSFQPKKIIIFSTNKSWILHKKWRFRTVC